MRVLSLLLVISLAGNAAFLLRGSLRGKSASPSSAAAAVGDNGPDIQAGGESRVAAIEPVAPLPIQGMALASALAGDLHSVVAGLRNAGVSPEVVRAIVRHRVDREFEGQLAAIAATETPYWMSPYMLAVSDRGKTLQELSRQMSDRIVDLIGTNFATAAEGARQRKDFDFLPPDKAAEVHRISADFSQRVAGASAAGLDTNELGREWWATLRTMLSPEEFEQYNLRKSNLSESLRARLREFDPTAQEYLAIFRLMLPIDERYGVGNPSERARETALLEPSIREVLGPERYAEYREMTNGDYLALSGLLRRLELPLGSMVEVLAIRDDIQQKAERIQSGGMSTRERQAGIGALTTEAENRLGEVLGEYGLSAYKQSSLGTWIMNGLRAPTFRSP